MLPILFQLKNFSPLILYVTPLEQTLCLKQFECSFILTPFLNLQTLYYHVDKSGTQTGAFFFRILSHLKSACRLLWWAEYVRYSRMVLFKLISKSSKCCRGNFRSSISILAGNMNTTLHVGTENKQFFLLTSYSYWYSYYQGMFWL